MNLLKATIIAGAGGFIGTCLRFLSEKLGDLICGTAFPLGTLLANVVGCFLIGLFYGWATKSMTLGKKGNLFLITGLCGGFTTFSSLSDELIGMIQSGSDAMFWLYLCGSIILGLIMVALGIACVKKQAPQQAQAA